MRLIILLFLISLTSSVFAEDCYRDGQDMVCQSTNKDGSVTTQRYHSPTDQSKNMQSTSPVPVSDYKENVNTNCYTIYWGAFGDVWVCPFVTQ